jgi:subtilisin family serine protease
MPPTRLRANDRYLVLLRAEAPREAARQLSALAHIDIAAPSARSRHGESAALRRHCAIVFDRIGVALVRCAADKHQLLAQLAADPASDILAVEPERTVYATMPPRRMPPTARAEPIPQDARAARARGSRYDENAMTWGIQAVGADKSPYTGKNIRIAVLDTGLDLQHPDFANRTIVSQSFIDGEAAQDGNGHGTHCAGIAGGPASVATAPRYGVAVDADLYIGKVLSDAGSGGDAAVLEGINWAIEHQCQVISMSLGSPAAPGQAYSRVFEEVARRALAAGAIIVAAAGNDSRRPDDIAPVSHPANCPSIMAVAALDRNMQVAPFSCGGLDTNGGRVDLAAPGVDVLSSWPAPALTNTISGTSMATPFVAGVAALYAEAGGATRGQSLVDTMIRQAAPLPLPERDVGAGLIQAP